MVLLAVFTWALSSIGYKKSLGTKGSVERDPITSLAFRNTIVTLFLTIVLPIFGKLSGLFTIPSEIRLEYWIFAFISGLMDLLGHACYFIALRHLDSSRVYPFISFQMLFTYPIAIFVFGDAIPQFLWLSMILIIIGVGFVGKPDNQDKGMENLSLPEKKVHNKKGILFGIATGAFFALFYLSMTMQNRIWNGVWESNYARLLLSSITICGYILLRPKHRPHFKTKEDKEKIKSYVMTGVFACLSAGIGDTLYQLGVNENGSNVSITIASGTPLLNQIFALIFLKEKFRPIFLIGVFFIIAGNILVVF